MIVTRNLIIAPLTEELVFRAVMTPTLYAHYATSASVTAAGLGHTDIWLVLILTPAFFAIAHVHHMYEKLRDGTPTSRATIETLVQATYTYIFGFISMVLLTRTSNLAASLLSHVICNFMGLPDISFMRPLTSIHPGQYSYLYKYRYILLLLHALGLALFSVLLFPLTSPLTGRSPYCK